MNILVTGGTGLLGGRISAYLKYNENYKIFIGVRQLDKNLYCNSNSEYVLMNWNSREQLEEVCKGIDLIIHCAGMNAKDCASNPSEAFLFNAVSTGFLLESAIKMKVKKIIYISTAHVYATHLKGIITEDTNPTNFHPYASSHKAAEDLIRYFSLQGKIEGVIVRLSNAYGFPVNKDVSCWTLLVNDLCKQAVISNKLTLRSNGMQRRDFVSIMDVCRAIEHIISIELQIEKNIINIGAGWSPTVWEMSLIIQERCKEVLGFEPELIRIQPGENEISEELEFNIKYLLSTGFQLGKNNIQEIDELLKFCKNNFIK